MTNKRYPTLWGDRDFDRLSWHDNPIHAIRLRNPRPDDAAHQYDFDLILEIDHILEWIKTSDGRAFVLPTAPARLVFHAVDHLSINIHLTYKQDLEVAWIEREEVVTEAERRAGTLRHRYVIHLHDTYRTGDESTISFATDGFTQELTGEIVWEGGEENGSPPPDATGPR